MDVYTTEEQQWEAIKKWFKTYGDRLSWALLIVMALISSATYWRHHQEVVQQNASDHYIALISALEKSDKTTVENEGSLLLKDFSSSSYATLAALALASNAVEQNDIAKAKEKLEWAIQNSKQHDLQAIARIRLMRILIDENKLDEALNLYNEKKAGGFLTLMAELKGDILIKKNNIPEARKAYELAYQAAPEEGMHGILLSMKMEELGIKPKAIAKDKNKDKKKEQGEEKS